MKGRVSILFLVLFLLVGSTVTIVKGQNTEIGVSKGDSFSYDVTDTFYTNETNFPFPHTNGTWSGEYTIDEISGDYLYVSETIRFENGSEQRNEHHRTSIGLGFGALLVIAPNLKAGDPFSSNFQNLIVNETLVRDYPGGTRELNYISRSGSNSGYDWHEDRYFDKTTGVMVELYQESEHILPYNASNPEQGHITYTFIETIKLKNTSVWTVSELPSVTGSTSSGPFVETPLGLAITIGGTLAIIVAVVLIVVRKRRASQPKQRA